MLMNKYAIYVDYHGKTNSNDVVSSRIHVNFVSVLCSSKSVKSISLKSKGKLRIWKVNMKDKGAHIQMIGELSIEMDANENVLMFITESNHLCFWNILLKKDRCFCAHHLGFTNDAATMALDCIFIGSPAQLHVVKISDVCSWGAIEERMTLCLQSTDESYPDQDEGYLLLKSEEEFNAWQSWSNKRVIGEMKRIESGVVYFIQNECVFSIIRCDKERVFSRYMRDNNFKECEALDSKDGTGQIPGALDAVQSVIQHQTVIQHIYLHQKLLFVLDEHYYLSIYTQFGQFVRRINVCKGETEEANEITIGFDGVNLWILRNQNQLHSVPFKAPVAGY
eukprot:19585_1